MVIFHSYVSLPEGISNSIYINFLLYHYDWCFWLVKAYILLVFQPDI